LALHSGCEADHSPPSSAEVKECVELYLHSPNTPSWRGAPLGGAQGQLYLPNYDPVIETDTESCMHVMSGFLRKGTARFPFFLQIITSIYLFGLHTIFGFEC
jgi:hypothetical protein